MYYSDLYISRDKIKTKWIQLLLVSVCSCIVISEQDNTNSLSHLL